jgi:hypothetical protein
MCGFECWRCIGGGASGAAAAWLLRAESTGVEFCDSDALFPWAFGGGSACRGPGPSRKLCGGDCMEKDPRGCGDGSPAWARGGSRREADTERRRVVAVNEL